VWVTQVLRGAMKAFAEVGALGCGGGHGHIAQCCEGGNEGDCSGGWAQDLREAWRRLLRWVLQGAFREMLSWAMKCIFYQHL
jgi:hypothetical protein